MSLDIQKNELHYYVDLLRGKEWSETGNALYNVIRTMRLSRHDKVCGEDFSQLDFGNIPFNGIHFSINGEYPCDFTGCKLNEWNFLSGHSGAVTAAVWSVDGNYMLTGSRDGSVILWDVETGLMMHKIDKNKMKVKHIGIIDRSNSVCIIIWDDNRIMLWNIEERKCYMDVQVPINTHTGFDLIVSLVEYYRDVNQYYKDSYYKASLSDNKYLLECFESGSIYLRDNHIDKAHQLETSLDSSLIRFACFSTENSYCMAITVSNIIKIWNVDSGRCLYVQHIEDESNQENYIATSGDGRYILYNYAELYDSIKDKFISLNSITKDEQIESSTFSADSLFCATVLKNYDFENYVLRIYETISGECLHTLEFSNKIQNEPSNEGNLIEITAMQLSSNNQYCAVALTDKILRIWDVKNEKCLYELLHADHITTISFSPNNLFCLVGLHNGTISIWDLRSGKKAHHVQTGYAPPVTSIAVTSDDLYCIVALANNTAKIWSLQKEKCIKSLSWYTELVEADEINGNDERIDIQDEETGLCLKITKGFIGHVCRLTDILNVWKKETGLQSAIKPIANHCTFKWDIGSHRRTYYQACQSPIKIPYTEIKKYGA